MVALAINETSLALAVAGGYVVVVGLVSYFVKEKLFMSEVLLATLAGIIFGPISLGWFNPEAWSTDVDYLTHQVCRIIIAIQVLFTGIALPKAYVRKEWMSLVVLLGPVMTTAWFVCSLLVWGLIPGLTFLESLVIGACITPTDPVLANSICKGRFAEKHVPLHVRNIIVAEAGANDGLGFPFLFLPLYLILINEPSHPVHSVGQAIGEWFYNILFYQVILSCIIGAVIGYVARKVLRFAEERQLIDHESFLSFGVALTFFTLGVVGILGSDDILCCFVVGNSFTWDDWFRVQTEDHAFQDVIDQLLNSAVFLYVGAVMPWSEFNNFESITPWRLVILGILVMLVRRLPWVMLLGKWIPTLPTWRESAFAGFFGPIGIGAIFYTTVALEVLPEDGTRTHLRAVLKPVNFFIVLTSIVVHGITIPIGKGFQHGARTMTQTRSQSGLIGTDNVSRLPPPMAIGSNELRNAVDIDRKRNSQGSTAPPQASSGQGAGDGPTIRFELDNSITTPTTPTMGGDIPKTGLSSRSNTPPAGTSNPKNVWVDRRETAAQRAKGETWLEGRDEVIESEDGENVRVVHSV